MLTIMIVPLNYNLARVKAKTRGFELCGGVRAKDNIFGMWRYFRGHVNQLTNVLDKHRQVFRVTQFQGRGGGLFLVTQLGFCRGLVLHELHQRASTPIWRTVAYFVTWSVQTKKVPAKFDISSNYSWTVPSNRERDGTLNALHFQPHRQNTSSTWTIKLYQAKWPLSVAPRLV